jgi:hypothetical protein
MRERATRRIDDQDVNKRREKPLITGISLHEYANLFMNPRNAMMYKRLREEGAPADLHADLCLLQVGIEVLDLEGTLVSDMNAAKDAALINAPQVVFNYMDADIIYAHYFGRDELTKAKSMAEVLVLERVPVRHIKAIIVSGHLGEHRLRRRVNDCRLPILRRCNLFFQMTEGPQIPPGREL